MDKEWQDELTAIFESIYKILSSIVIEMEEVLSPLFTKNCNMEEVQDIMISLFKMTRNRGNFKRWVIYLTKQLESGSFSHLDTKVIADLIFILNEIFFNYFYEIVPENVERDSLHLPIHYLQNKYPPKKELNVIKELAVNIINPSQNAEVREIQRVASRYLYEIRCAMMDFEGLME